MRRTGLFLLASLLLGSAQADTTGQAAQPLEVPAPPLVAIERQGYAFNFPRILAQQRLFGIAHGVGLLAHLCGELPAQAAASAEAYTAWYQQQQPVIAAAHAELARYYFGPRAAEADQIHLVRALNLRETLSLAPDSPELAAACASLPQALSKPRYDLALLFRLEAAIAAVTIATRFDTQVAVCMVHLSEPERAALTQQYALWLEAQEQQPAITRAWLLDHWSNLGMDDSAEAWLLALKKKFSQPPPAACHDLAQRLENPAAALALSFEPAPEPIAETIVPPTVISEEAPPEAIPESTEGIRQPERALLPQSLPTPSTAAQTAPSAPITPAEEPNLFDFLMRLFDDRSPQPARSQRAHP